MKYLFALLIISATVIFVACGQKLEASKVPVPVKESFSQHFPGATAKWEKEDEKFESRKVKLTKIFDKIVSSYEVVDWHKRTDIINKIELEFGDYLMDMFDVPMSKADELTEKAIAIAIANR